jgi:hypothetical protein
VNSGSRASLCEPGVQDRPLRGGLTAPFAEENMKKIIVILKWFLIILGGLTLLGGGYFAYKIGPGNRDKTDSASLQDVRFVLNWCNLGDDRIEKVVKSHVSSRSMTGDHLDAYAIKIKDVSIEELTSKTDGKTEQWYRGDKLPKVLDDGVSFVGSFLNSGEIPWFPKESELRSAEIYVYPWTMYFHGVHPTAAEIIIVRPKDKMVFFLSGKT